MRQKIIKFQQILIFQQFQMNFDGLDDDLDIGYTPTINTKSRSAGMKKPARKAQTKPTPVNTKKQDDFDLLDQLLASPVKNKPAPEKSKSTHTSKNNNNDDVQSFFDEPSIPTIKNPQKNQKMDTTSINRPVTAKPIINSTPIEDPIVQQIDTKINSSFKFKRPETAVHIPSKPPTQEQHQITVSPSLRMMKPPLRKRDSKEEKKEQITKTGGFGLGLTLSEDLPKKQIEEQSKFKPLMNSNRRSSIQMSTHELNIDNPYEIEQKNKNDSQHRDISNNFNEPKSNLFSSFGTEKNKQQRQHNQDSEYRLQIKPQTKPQPKKPLWQTQKNVSLQQQTNSYTFNKNPSLSLQQPIQNQQIQKEIDFIKRNYQKHIDSLQKNLEEQIKTNKESRDRLMRQTNNMIQNERNRMKKIHQQELDRVKQMGEWEKKKIEENYKAQVQSLKNQLSLHTETAQRPKDNISNSLYNQRKQIQYLQEKLRSQRKLLQEKSRLLDRRQTELQQREQQFNKNKRLEEERLRNEERRIFQYEMDSKKNLLHEKRLLEDEKQAIATQMATLQMGNYKKVQRVELLKTEIDRQKRQIERERSEMRKINSQMLQDYQKKSEQLKLQKEKFARMQSELLGKIKIVQAHATRQRANTSNPTKQNNWVNNTTISNQHNRVDDGLKKAMSVEKQAHQKKLENTQNKFLQMTANIGENFKIGKKGKQFDLDSYLMSMAQYTRHHIN